MPAESFGIIQSQAPIGQSFTPSLSAVGFIRLDLFDLNFNNGKGATVYVNVRANSITGTILGSSIPVVIPDSFGASGGFTNFVFDAAVPVVSGTVYYFDLVAQTGSDFWAVRRFVQGSDYLGGIEYIQGLPGIDDLWFREGVIIPEPASIALLVVGAGFILMRKRRDY